jgi:hypothetical protein
MVDYFDEYVEIGKKTFVVAIILLICSISFGSYEWYSKNKISNKYMADNSTITFELNNKTKQIVQYQEQTLKLNNQINEYEKQVDDYKGMSLIDYTPTLEEVEEILEEDKINEAEYNETDFNCVEYSNGLVHAFLNNNIFACHTELDFSDGAHALVTVNTSDNGIIYIEPQDDTIFYNLNIGDNYCKLANWDCEEDDWVIVKLKSCFSEIDY